MPFDNESTVFRMVSDDREELFHQMYEEQLEKVKPLFNKEYPNLVEYEIFENEKLIHVSPIDGKTELGKFQMSSEETCRLAAEKARGSYLEWYKKGYAARASIFLRAADLMSERKFEFAAILSNENGKNRYESFADVDEAIDYLRFYALNLIQNEGFVRFTGTTLKTGEKCKSVMKPYGTFLVIAPFNYIAIAVGMTTGPLITGNSVILKPSSDIPVSTYRFVELLYEAGVPRSNLIFLAGSGSRVGKALYTNDNVDGVAFTGSKETGMKIYHGAQESRPKVMVTEMGGKDAVIVTAKGDLDKAAQGVALSAFGYSGQKCSACSLALVDESVYEEFKKKVVEYARKLSIGDPRKRESYTGPVINRAAYEKFRKVMETVPEDRILLGGKALEKDGYYVENTILDNVNDPNIERTELFLPVVALKPVKSLDDSIKLVNSLEYGLTGGIFSEDYREVEYYFDHAHVGVVYANRKQGGSTGAIVGSQPFVGWKFSGTSGKGTGSFYYLQQFLREQSQTIVNPQ